MGQIKSPCSETCKGLSPHSGWETKFFLCLMRLSPSCLSPTLPPAVTSLTQAAPHAGLCRSDTPWSLPTKARGFSSLYPGAFSPTQKPLPPFSPLGLSSNVTCSGSHSQQTLPILTVHRRFLLHDPHSSPFAMLAFLLHLYLADNLIATSRDNLPNQWQVHHGC